MAINPISSENQYGNMFQRPPATTMVVPSASTVGVDASNRSFNSEERMPESSPVLLNQMGADTYIKVGLNTLKTMPIMILPSVYLTVKVAYSGVNYAFKVLYFFNCPSRLPRHLVGWQCTKAGKEGIIEADSMKENANGDRWRKLIIKLSDGGVFELDFQNEGHRLCVGDVAPPDMGSFFKALEFEVAIIFLVVIGVKIDSWGNGFRGLIESRMQNTDYLCDAGDLQFIERLVLLMNAIEHVPVPRSLLGELPNLIMNTLSPDMPDNFKYCVGDAIRFDLNNWVYVASLAAIMALTSERNDESLSILHDLGSLGAMMTISYVAGHICSLQPLNELDALDNPGQHGVLFLHGSLFLFFLLNIGRSIVANGNGKRAGLLFPRPLFRAIRGICVQAVPR